MRKLFTSISKPFRLGSRRRESKEASFQETPPPDVYSTGHWQFTGLPELVTAPSMRERVVSQRLQKAPSLTITPSVLHAIALIPNEVTLDRQRLLDRLEEYGLTERVVKGDGACQFRSLSDQLYGSPAHHEAVRHSVVQHLRMNKDRYAMYVPQDYASYCDEMSMPFTWGDHVTLQAAADVFGVKIMVLTSYEENCVIKIDPAVEKSDRVLWISFWAEVHYNSIYPKEHPPGPIYE